MDLRHAAVIAALAIAAAVPAFPQNDRLLEVYGGYALQEENTVVDRRHGWVASQTAYIRPWIGIELELSGLYGDRPYLNPGGPSHGSALDDNLHSYLVGPRFRLIRRERLTLGAHSLIGLSQRRSNWIFQVPETDQIVHTSWQTNDLGGAVGVSLDVHLSERFSWRIQPDWMIRKGAIPDHFLRVSTGVVFRFGR